MKIKSPTYSAKTFVAVTAKLTIASDKLFDAIDSLTNAPYKMADRERFIKRFQKMWDQLDKLQDDFEKMDEKYWEKGDR